MVDLQELGGHAGLLALAGDAGDVRPRDNVDCAKKGKGEGAAGRREIHVVVQRHKVSTLVVSVAGWDETGQAARARRRSLQASR